MKRYNLIFLTILVFISIFGNAQKVVFPNKDFHFEINENILSNGNCVMTDVYNSMNDKEDKENILKKFQVNTEIMSKLADTSVFMHCLPAKIGSEVTLDVIKSNQSIVLQQAKNRMIAQRGILKWLDI